MVEGTRGLLSLNCLVLTARIVNRFVIRVMVRLIHVAFDITMLLRNRRRYNVIFGRSLVR